jgi:hypothetical protein
MRSFELDSTLTTMGDFRRATKELKDDVRMYVDHPDFPSLIEITDIMLHLPKDDNDRTCLILRAR